jgi:DoxX-like family
VTIAQSKEATVKDEQVTAGRSRWHRIRLIAYWTSTIIIVFELAAGSVWNFQQIEWIRVQLHHLGYPIYFSTISGVWQLAGAFVLIAPGFPRIKEWAYAGAFFTWSGAVASHLFAGDGAESWMVPLMFAIFAIVSWALKPADHRLPNAGLASETRPRAWAIPIGVLLLLFIASYLTLPAVNAALHTRARDLGWLREYQERVDAR